MDVADVPRRDVPPRLRPNMEEVRQNSENINIFDGLQLIVAP